MRISVRLKRPAARRDLAELTFREEREPLPIRGKKWGGATFGPGQIRELSLSQPARGKPKFAVATDYGCHQVRAIPGDGQQRAGPPIRPRSTPVRIRR